MAEIDARLRENVHLLGQLLGDTLRAQLGSEFFDKIERVRKGAKRSRRESSEGTAQLTAILDGLDSSELLPVVRAFSHFLNLANIAEQYHQIHRRRAGEAEPFELLALPVLLDKLLTSGLVKHWPSSSANWRLNWY